jgi:hypothetical protein
MAGCERAHYSDILRRIYKALNIFRKEELLELHLQAPNGISVTGWVRTESQHVRNSGLTSVRSQWTSVSGFYIDKGIIPTEMVKHSIIFYAAHYNHYSIISRNFLQELDKGPLNWEVPEVRMGFTVKASTMASETQSQSETCDGFLDPCFGECGRFLLLDLWD